MGKFFKGSKKGKDLHESKENNYDNIVIKKDRRKFWLKSILKLLGFIISVLVVSFLAFKYYTKYISIEEQRMSLLNEIKDGGHDITKLVNKLATSVVTISDSKDELSAGKNNGRNISGTIIRTDGYILTSYSSIKDFKEIYVKLSSNDVKPFKASIIGFNEDTDLVVLKIESSGLRSIPTSELEVLEIGERVATIGNVTSEESIGFVANGIVTSPLKKVTIGEEKHSDSKVFNVVETTSLINKENNGGILCDYNGMVVGINSLYFTDKFQKQGVYYALEINDALRIADSIIRKGEVSVGVTLGVTGTTVDDNEHNVYGIYVEDVDKGSNAFNSGIRPTDIIVEIDGKKIKNIEELAGLLKKHSVGNIIKVKVIRGEDTKEILVTLS